MAARFLGRLRRPLFASISLALAALSAAACGASDDPDVDASEDAVIDRNQTPMSKARLDGILAARPQLKSLDQLPAALPKDFVVNFTLKHGKLRDGERGHLVERDVSQSSDPLAPRVIMWDERSGFTVSYNGGTPGQTEGQRLDVLEFDGATKAFRLSGLEFNGRSAPVYQTDADIAEPGRKCARCHGPTFRPIFSMYPDWPSFYGSDNDELTDTSKEVQAIELRDYRAFTADVATRRLPRYLPLFDRDNVRTQFRGTELYPTFPYRQNTDTAIRAVSRAFAFRPSLRLGILQNRLMAQNAAARIAQHPNASTFGPLFLHGLLECRWSDPSALQNSGWIDRVKTAIGRTPRTVAGGRTLHYRDLLALFGLDVRDIDIRYSYNHSGYENEDATTKVMEVGYIDGEYWNSYFDGSATIDELLAMHVAKALSTSSVRGLDRHITSPDGLVVKYSRLAERYAFDENFFEEMDRKGTWIPIPYPRERIHDLHHREGYPERFSTQHRALCGALETHLRSASPSPQPAPPPAASCPSGCIASTYCKDHPNASQAIKVNGLPCMVSGAGGCQPCR